MSAYKPRTEIMIRVALVAVVLFNGLIPTTALAKSSTLQGPQPTTSPTETVTETPTSPSTETATTTPELSATPMPTAEETAVPAYTVTPTPTQEGTLTPSETPTSTLTPSPSVTPTFSTTASEEPDLSFNISTNPEQASPGEDVTFTIEITNNGDSIATGLLFSNTLPEYFGKGQSGFKDFDFDPQTRKLTWKGIKANGENVEILGGQTLTISYTVKVESKSTEVQIVDTATLAAEGLLTPMLAESTITVVEAGKKLTMIDAKGGKALGLGGKVKVTVPEKSLTSPAAILIEDLTPKGELPSKSKDKTPWLQFSLEMKAPQPANAQILSAPTIDQTPVQPWTSASPTAEVFVDSSEGDENIVNRSLTPNVELSTSEISIETATPNPEHETVKQEQDMIIPIETVEARFEIPIQLTISLEGVADLAILGADQTPFVVTLDDNSNTWVRVPLTSIDRDNNTISAEITHFSTWGAGIGPTFPQKANVLLFEQADPDLFTGGSGYSVPIWTPPGRNGMAPSLSLSYSSRRVDGILGDIQSAWVGMGWNIDTVEIARKIAFCTQNCSPAFYGYENKFLLLFNGTGYELIPDGSTPGRYHTKEESFLYIQLHNDSLGNNSPAAQNTTGEWWEVVERDGTRWRLGWNNDSEQLSSMIGYPGAATGAWSSLGYAGHALGLVAYRWRADRVTDTFGNGITIAYYEEHIQGFDGRYYDSASYVDTITYATHTSGLPAPGYSVAFIREQRGTFGLQIVGENIDSYQLDRIDVKYGSSIVRTYDLGYQTRSYSDDGVFYSALVLSTLAISGGSTNSPSITFGYTDKDNRANCGTGCQEWAYPRLESVSNGWGSTVVSYYENDGRPSTSWYNWRVETFNLFDGVNPSPMKTTFAYSLPCYKDTTAGWCNGSNVGELVGYAQNIETAKDFNNNTLAITLHKFHVVESEAGREYEVQHQNAGGTILSQTNTAYTVVTSGLPSGVYFTYASAKEEYLRTTYLARVSKTEYEYDTTTGNLIHQKEYDGMPSLYRQTDYEYVTNMSPSIWILDTLARSTLKDAVGTVFSKQEFGYDGSLPGTGSPTTGKLTISREVNGTQTIDKEYIHDTYGNLTDTYLFKSYGTSGTLPTGLVLVYSTGYDSSLKTYVTSSDPPLIPATVTTYDYGLGIPTSTTDSNGNITSTAYDGLGRITSVTYPGSAQPNVKYSYPTLPVSAPFALKMELWDQTASVYRSIWQVLDGLGREIQSQSPYETTGYLVLTDTSYNAQGLALNNGLPRTLNGTGGAFFTPSWGSIPHTTTSYDALERPVLISYPDGSQETFDISGLRTTSIDRNNHQKIEERDAFWRLIKVEEYTGNSAYALYATTTYEYDVRDLFKKSIDAAGNQINIGYDGFGRKIAISDPDLGVWGYGYDVWGNLTSQTDSRGCVTNVTYDDLNRPTLKTYSGPGACNTTPTVTFTYDSTSGGNKGIGYRTGMTDGSGSTTWFYNALGQVTNETHNIDSTNYAIGTSFDAFERPLSQTLPSGEVLNYSYNAMGALFSLSGTNTYVSQIHYTASGQMADQLLGNSLRQQSCYDANTLRPTNTRVYSGALQSCGTNPSSPLLNLTYTYQPNGNVSQMVDSTRSETLNYSYDELDRLLSVSGSYNQSYSYDTIGNLTSKGTSDTTSVVAIVSVTTGFNHSCALTNSGGVICWGSNDYGQLGDGTTTSRLTPVMVSGLSSGVVAVEAGGFHTCALTLSGGVKCWGQNTYGVLGDGTQTNRTTPVNVSGLTSGVIAISAGYVNTCALTTSGGVKCWGYNVLGGVGDGTTVSPRLTPVNVSGLTSGVSAISTGIRHSCALTTGGGVKCWGQNAYGQLGDGTTTDRTAPVNVSGLTSGVASISAGEQHSCARTTGGGAKCWGTNSNGQLGDNTTTQRLTPVYVNGLTSGVTAIAAGNFHTCALITNGGMKCWGKNNVGQLGDGTTTQSLTPVDVSGLTSGVALLSPGLSHTCARVSGGWVKCWGENYTFGRLGDGTTVQRTTAINISGLTNGGSPLETGGFHTCSITASRGAKCWGANGNGQLGDGTTTQRLTPVNVSGLTSGVASISAGYLHTCALTTAGGVKCWGNNGNGQLGDATTTQRLTPVFVSGLTSGVIAVTTGSRHTCALTTGGGVKCWGQNSYGQLGDGTTTQRLTPVYVSGLTTGVIAISAGEQHTCALTTSGGVKCWGDNTYGQLGDGTTTQRLTPVNVSGLTSGVTLISAGNFHTCAITTGGGIKCWGNNGHGQLGDGTTTQRLTPVNVSGFTSGVTTAVAGIDQSCMQTDGSGMNCWGYNIDGRLGDGTTIQRTTPVSVSGLNNGNVLTSSTGFNHSCALTNGEQKCWGDNTYGQLGDGTTTQRLTPATVISGSMATYTYGNSAHKHAVTSLTTGETYTYDANGNMTQRVEGGLTYTQTFDAGNRLISVTVNGQTTQFIYDGDGNLVKKVNPDGSKTIYVSGIYEVDKTSGGSVTRTVTYYPAAGAMRIDSAVYYVATDLLNSASVVTNSAGVMVGDQRYYPYGETRYVSGNMLTDRLFTGQQEIAGLGIYNFDARFYSPKLGRFLSADTVIPNTRDPQAYNRFAYVLNNPTRFLDPTGHVGCDNCTSYQPSTSFISYTKEHGLCIKYLGCSGGESYKQWWQNSYLPILKRNVSTGVKNTINIVAKPLGVSLDAYETWNGIPVPKKYGFGIDFIVQLNKDSERTDLDTRQKVLRATVNGFQGIGISFASSAAGTMLGEAALGASMAPAVASEQLWLPPVAYWAGWGTGYLATNYALGNLAEKANREVIYPLLDLGEP